MRERGVARGTFKTNYYGILYLSPRGFQEGSATAGDGPNGVIILDRTDSPGATNGILRR